MKYISEDDAISEIDNKRRRNWPRIDSTGNSYSVGTVGNIVQENFRNHIATCNLGVSLDNRDYIPRDVKMQINEYINDTVETAAISIENILFYKFHRNEISLPIDRRNFTLVNQRLPLLDFQSRFNYEAAEGFPSFLYIGNCTSQISSDLTAEFKPPIASVSTAVQMDNQKNSKLIIYSGRFSSPLTRVFSSPSIEQTLVLFDLWDFYRNSPEFIDSSYYLREFNGIAIKHFSNSAEVSRLDLTASANIGMIPMTEVTANAELSKSVKNLFNSKNWRTLMYPEYDDVINTRESFFEPLKSIDYIKTYFINNTNIIEENAPPIRQGSIYRHDLFIEGFPESKSSGNYWELDSISAGLFEPNSINVTSSFGTFRGAKGCKITVSGMPISSIFASSSSAGDLNVYYRFRNTSSFSLNNERIKIAFKNGIIQINKSPILHYETFVDAEKVNIQGDSIVRFKWTIKPVVLDRGNEINKDILPIIDSLVAISGRERLAISPIGQGLIQVNRLTNEYKLELRTNNEYNLNGSNRLVESKTYNLTIFVRFTLNQSGRQIRKTISTIISIPDVGANGVIINR